MDRARGRTCVADASEQAAGLANDFRALGLRQRQHALERSRSVNLRGQSISTQCQAPLQTNLLADLFAQTSTSGASRARQVRQRRQRAASHQQSIRVCSVQTASSKKSGAAHHLWTSSCLVASSSIRRSTTSLCLIMSDCTWGSLHDNSASDKSASIFTSTHDDPAIFVCQQRVASCHGELRIAGVASCRSCASEGEDASFKRQGAESAESAEMTSHDTENKDQSA